MPKINISMQDIENLLDDKTKAKKLISVEMRAFKLETGVFDLKFHLNISGMISRKTYEIRTFQVKLIHFTHFKLMAILLFFLKAVQ